MNRDESIKTFDIPDRDRNNEWPFKGGYQRPPVPVVEKPQPTPPPPAKKD